jgi:hypothetical protein
LLSGVEIPCKQRIYELFKVDKKIDENYAKNIPKEIFDNGIATSIPTVRTSSLNVAR